MKPTREQFVEYVLIRDSGITNMFDINFITRVSNTGLSKRICIYIMQNFLDLAKEYNVPV